MRASIVIVLVLATSVAATAYPRHAFLDLPVAVSLGDPGRSYLKLGLADMGPSLRIGRAIGSRLDLSARIAGWDPFSLELRALLLENFGPLSVAVDLAHKEFRLVVGLFFGPVRVDWGRTFGQERERWAVLSISPDQRFSLVIGLEMIVGGTSFLGGIRLFQAGGPWGGSVLFHRQRLELAFGGYF